MKILFIGNSHTYFNDMPHLFARMHERLSGRKPEVTMLAYSGRDLKWHHDEYFSLRFALLYGHYDYCLIQQQAHPFPEEDFTEQYLAKVIDLCRQTHTAPIIYMTWAAKKQPEMADAMSRFYRRMAEKYETQLLNIGELFAFINESHPEVDLYWKDGEHASPYGDYLIAAALNKLLLGVCDLEKLDSTAIDFQVHFSDSHTPEASLDRDSLTMELDKEKTAVIRQVIEKTGC